MIHIEIDRSLKPLANAIAYLYGFKHGEKGSMTQLCEALFRGNWLLQPAAVPWTEEHLYRVQAVLIKFYEHERNERPFTFTYSHADGSWEEAQAFYGEVVLHEKRLYLDVWVNEPDPHQSGGLSHNRSIPLDQVKVIGETTAGKWRNGLDRVAVTLQLAESLVMAGYEKQFGEKITYTDGKIFTTRFVCNLNRLLREILPYGADCIVVSPDDVREKMRAIAKQMAENYKGGD